MSHPQSNNLTPSDDEKSVSTPTSATTTPTPPHFIQQRPSLIRQRREYLNADVRPTESKTDHTPPLHPHILRLVDPGREPRTPTGRRRAPTPPTICRALPAVNDESPSLNRAMVKLDLRGPKVRAIDTENSSADDDDTSKPSGNISGTHFQHLIAVAMSDPEPMTADNTPSTSGETLSDVDGMSDRSPIDEVGAGLLVSTHAELSDGEGALPELEFKSDHDDSQSTIHGLPWDGEGDLEEEHAFYVDSEGDDDSDTEDVLGKMDSPKYGGKKVQGGSND